MQTSILSVSQPKPIKSIITLETYRVKARFNHQNLDHPLPEEKFFMALQLILFFLVLASKLAPVEDSASTVVTARDSHASSLGLSLGDAAWMRVLDEAGEGRGVLLDSVSGATHRCLERDR